MGAGRPVLRGQAAPGVVDQGGDSGEQALPLEAPLGEVADGLALEVVELVQEVGPPRVGLGRRVGVVLPAPRDLDDPADPLVVRLESAQLQDPQEAVERHDHTVAQEPADSGLTTERDVLWKCFRNTLSRAIGISETEVDSEVRWLQLSDGDRLLLCTDGLTDMVDEATIGAALGQQGSLSEASRALIDLALDRGGRDNVTVVVADYHIASGP